MKLAGAALLLGASLLFPILRLRILGEERRFADKALSFFLAAENEISYLGRPMEELAADFWRMPGSSGAFPSRCSLFFRSHGASGQLLCDYLSAISSCTVEGGIRLTRFYAEKLKEEESRLSRQCLDTRRLLLPLCPTLAGVVILFFL